MNLRILTLGMAICALLSGSSRGEFVFVVAGNLPSAQNYALAFEEVGLIAPNYNNYNNVSKGQTFIPKVPGVLTEVDALVILGKPKNVTAYPSLRVSIFTSNAGIPISHLATVQVPKMQFTPFVISGNFRETFDFRDYNIALTAATEYMVVFATPFGVNGTSGGDSAYLIGHPNMLIGQSASQARDGIVWERFGHRVELGIEVRAVVPEPTTLALLSLGSVCLLRATIEPHHTNPCPTRP
jgi:hypothetical protein